MKDTLKHLLDNPNGSITELHEVANKEGYDGDTVDAVVYALAQKMARLFFEGRSNEGKVDEPDSDELKAGIEVEKEHVGCELIAEKIARDHLAELSDYYTRLKKMESN